MKQLFLRAAAPLFAAAVLWGCTTEKEQLPVPGPDASGAVTVTLKMPAPITVGSYAMSAKKECDVVTVDMLVFDPANKFLYREKGAGISDGTTDTERIFSVKIRKTENPNTISAFFCANVQDRIDAALGDWLVAGVTKAEVIQKLVFDLPVDQSENEGGKWLVPPGRYTRFPMWGEAPSISLTGATIQIPPINMLRATAKIDVGVAFPTSGTQQEVAQGQSNFFLEEFYLYNASTKLQVIPDAAKLAGTKVTAVSIPQGTGVFGDADDPIAYKRRTYNADGYKSFMNEIYCAEHAAGSSTDRPNNPCIVVGARFGGMDAPVTYYRIDLVKTTFDPTTGIVTNEEYLPVLRNHRYKINITAARGRGYATPREAFDAIGLNTNLTVVITCTDSNVTEIVYDGEHMLGVDHTAFTVDRRAHGNKQVHVLTDYPRGWTAETSDPWLHIQSASGAANTGTELVYSIDEFSGGTEARTGTIGVTAGRLYLEIKVTQSNMTQIVAENVKSVYTMNGQSYTFTLKSLFDWRVRVEDEYNAVESFMQSGSANTAGINYEFTLVNDIRMNAIGEGKTVTLTFYSEKDEFDPEIVQLHVSRYFLLETGSRSFFVYSFDQPTGYNWYTYANVADGDNTGSPRPGEAGQINPPRENSCASLPSETDKKWRLPDGGELGDIKYHIEYNELFLEWNFTMQGQYWSGDNSFINSHANVNSIGGSVGSGGTPSKGNTGYLARCIRDI